jgi:ATP-dependent 26S proteasome regulatory subunit
VVVLFDECDELFRDRKPSEGNDQLRSISAFVTASMLPKLQDLHDRGQVLFVICTNHVHMMDPAVLRGGRMDHRIGVPPPDRHARGLIIDGIKKLPDVPHREAALKELARSAERFSRSELIRAATKLTQQGEKEPWDSADQATDAVERLVQSMSESLTISPDLMEQFEKDKGKWSDPVLFKA